MQASIRERLWKSKPAGWYDSCMKRFHILLTGISLILLAISINRLGSFTLSFVAANQFLRWVDLNAMLLIPLATVILYYLLKKNIEQNGRVDRSRWLLWLNLFFICGLYLNGVSSGDHETTNYLHTRFCGESGVSARLCDIITYHDDVFSHVLYYLSVILLSGALLGIEAIKPRKKKISNRDIALILANALFIATGVFANLAFEPVALDIVAFTLLSLVSMGFLWFRARSHIRQFPVTIYMAVSYSAGLMATGIYKLLHL
jgi:Ca2+/Na+ antiporter